MKSFLLDDIKTPPDCEVICRTAADAYITLEKEQGFIVYYFDHDLGSSKPGASGYDVLRWALENEALNKEAIIFIITDNPVGRQNMSNLLLSFNYRCIGRAVVPGTNIAFAFERN